MRLLFSGNPNNRKAAEPKIQTSARGTMTQSQMAAEASKRLTDPKYASTKKAEEKTRNDADKQWAENRAKDLFEKHNLPKP